MPFHCSMPGCKYWKRVYVVQPAKVPWLTVPFPFLSPFSLKVSKEEKRREKWLEKVLNQVHIKTWAVVVVHNLFTNKAGGREREFI